MNKQETMSQECHVLMMPNYCTDNPYQVLLANALKKEAVTVSFPTGYKRLFPLYRQTQLLQLVSVLHLHWLDPYIKGNNLWKKGLYALKFIADLILVKSKKIRVIWTIHNFVSHNSKYPKFEQWLQQQMIYLADQVIVHSDAAKQIIKENYHIDDNKIHVIAHGHYRDVYQLAIAPTEAKNQLNVAAADLTFLNCGMLRPYKGLEKLLDVWSQNKNTLQTCQLVIAGKALNPAYATELQQKMQNATNIYLFNEFIPDEQIHLYFSAADVVVLPFNQILTSGSLILAMSYGKPIIAPAIASITEILGTATDLLYDPQDPQGLAQAIVKAQQINLQALSQKTNDACDALNWELIAQKTANLYRNIP